MVSNFDLSIYKSFFIYMWNTNSDSFRDMSINLSFLPRFSATVFHMKVLPVMLNHPLYHIYRVVKKADTRFIFAITSANEHQFWSLATQPSKTNSAAVINADMAFLNTKHFLNKAIYAYHWLKYLLTYSQQWIVTSLLRNFCVLFNGMCKLFCFHCSNSPSNCTNSPSNSPNSPLNCHNSPSDCHQIATTVLQIALMVPEFPQQSFNLY